MDDNINLDLYLVFLQAAGIPEAVDDTQASSNAMGDRDTKDPVFGWPVHGEPGQPDYNDLDNLTRNNIQNNLNLNNTNNIPFGRNDQFDLSAQAVSFNMPGAFKNDNMDLDDLPPFTMELLEFYVPPQQTEFGDLLFAPQLQYNALLRVLSYNNMSYNNSYNENDSMFMEHDQDKQHQNQQEKHQQEKHQNLDGQDAHFQLENHQNLDDKQLNHGHLHQENHLHPDQSTTDPSVSEHLRQGSIDSHYLGLESHYLGLESHYLGLDGHHLGLAVPSYLNASVNKHLSELSPLTTTTSLTPSIGSVHSTQPLFFSAQQYFSRNSFDQPPSSIHRPSFDMYKPRPSIDLLHSSQQPLSPNLLPQNLTNHSPSSSITPAPAGRYLSFTNSITNMIPFMGDKSQRSPILGPSSPQFINHQSSLRQPQLRHLIRSIFKLSNQLQPQPQLDENDETFLAEDEDEKDDEEEPKKVKRSKRSLFTRFKNQDSQQQGPGWQGTGPGATGGVGASGGSGQLSGVSSGANGGAVVGSESDASSFSNPTEADSRNPSVPQLEVDYSALFENVGKRKNIVQLSYRKAKRTDEAKTSMESTHDAESALSSSSGPVSATSSHTEDSNVKRVLGSKLLARKKSQLLSGDGSNAVEVDLALLDLPADTQIYPTTVINLQTRTRGRKENKEADVLDQSKIYLCNYCLRRFKRQEHLKRHFRSLHTFEKPYDCPICNKKFSRSDNLNQHLKTHKQEEEEYMGGA